MPIVSKPASPTPERTITLTFSPGERGVGVFRITAGGKSHFYTFCEIPCHIGGRGYAVHRTGVGNLYHVRVGTPSECSCECMGFLRHSKCRHILGLQALIANGKI